MSLSHFPETARIWVFTADKAVTEVSRAAAIEPVMRFLEQWATHGKALTATAEWVNSWQLVIALDESKTGASGCSIDTLTRFMRELGEHLQVNWFDRMKILVRNNEEDQLISFAGLSDYPEAFVYDPLIQTLGELRSNWPVKVSKSRFSHLAFK